VADITKCDGVIYLDGKDADCPRKEQCYRHMAPENPYRQSYFMLAPIQADGTCQEYVPNTWEKEYDRR